VEVALPESGESLAPTRRPEEFSLRPLLPVGEDGGTGNAVEVQKEIVPDKARIAQKIEEFETYLGKLPKGRLIISVNGITDIVEGQGG